MATKRKCMTLEERVKCLKLLESGRSSRVVASEMCVGRSQVQGVLKRKREIMEEYEGNGNIEMKRHRRDSECRDLNTLVYRWFMDATARLVNVTGPMIQEKARSLAADLNLTDFKGSNGWLDRFLKRNNIVFKARVGERGEVCMNTVKEWKDSISDVCQGYDPSDIFNMDESGLFYRDTAKTTFCKKGDSCSGGKASKQRITIALCASMTGEKLKPLVIGKSARPRCFGRLSTDRLPVQYESNNKAWMLTPVFEKWVNDLDRRMVAQKRKILLFLDNVPVHPKITLRNVKLQFFPKNTTSVLQPMDAGIIQAVKLKYRRPRLQHVIAELEKNKVKLGPEILREITILQAIYWVSGAWREVGAKTITKCFAKCGFTPEVISSESSQFVEPVVESETDVDDECPLAVLKMARELFDCDFRDLLEIDSAIHTCDNNMISWEKNANDILSEINGESVDSESVEVDEDSSEPENVTFSQVAECLQTLKRFALCRGQGAMLDNVMNMEDMFVELRVDSSVKQAKISDFFKS